MDNTYIPYQESYPNLEKALEGGAKIHIFRSGGGLRVVRIEKEEKLVSYGEYPYFAGAMEHAENDFGMDYKAQYSGTHSKHTHYLTGAYPMAHDIIDSYIFCGKTLDIFYSKNWNKFVCVTTTTKIDRDENEIIWGSGTSILYAISACFTSFNFEDKDVFMSRV